MVRLEMFVPEEAWRNCKDLTFKQNLLGLVRKVEFELIEGYLRDWNVVRFKSKPSDSDFRGNLLKVKFPQSYKF